MDFIKTMFALTLCFQICCVGCGNGNEESAESMLVGIWGNSSSTIECEPSIPTDFDPVSLLYLEIDEMVFNGNGTLSLEVQGETLNGTWKIVDNSLILRTSDREFETEIVGIFALQGNSLTIITPVPGWFEESLQRFFPDGIECSQFILRFLKVQ